MNDLGEFNICVLILYIFKSEAIWKTPSYVRVTISERTCHKREKFFEDAILETLLKDDSSQIKKNRRALWEWLKKQFQIAATTLEWSTTNDILSEIYWTVFLCLWTIVLNIKIEYEKCVYYSNLKRKELNNILAELPRPKLNWIYKIPKWSIFKGEVYCELLWLI